VSTPCGTQPAPSVCAPVILTTSVSPSGPSHTRVLRNSRKRNFNVGDFISIGQESEISFSSAPQNTHPLRLGSPDPSLYRAEKPFRWRTRALARFQQSRINSAQIPVISNLYQPTQSVGIDTVATRLAVPTTVQKPHGSTQTGSGWGAVFGIPTVNWLYRRVWLAGRHGG
jgi:hypothetical protein